MSLKERMIKWVINRRIEIQRGREITEQMRAERLRKRNKRIDNMKPGAVKAIADGFRSRSSPMDVMKAEYRRRKHDRNKK